MPLRALQQAMLDRVGSTLGERYRLVELLGFGGMGAVYRARNIWASRDCALKVFHGSEEQDQGMLKRFLREGHAANRIRKGGRLHPNVIDVLDVGRDRETGWSFLVEELLSGESLADRLERAPGARLALGDVLGWFMPIADAVATAHMCGVVHRDIKPENIYLCEEPGAAAFPKLLDFGISRLTHDRMTARHEVLGTPDYLAPETFMGSDSADERSDVWALGVVLYETLLGEWPFGPRGGRFSDVMRAIASADVETLPGRTRLPSTAWEIIRICLQSEPRRRFADGRALLRALESLASECTNIDRAAVATVGHTGSAGRS
jgi:serine/threonine protein kinase